MTTDKKYTLFPETADASYVYFVRAGDTQCVKIGYADDLKKRLAGLQVGNYELLRIERYLAFDLKVQARECEAVLHDYFCDKAIRNEWFRLTPKDVAYASGHYHKIWREYYRHEAASIVDGAIQNRKAAADQAARLAQMRLERFAKYQAELERVRNALDMQTAKPQPLPAKGSQPVVHYKSKYYRQRKNRTDS